MERTGSESLSDVKRRVLIVVAHVLHERAYRQFLLRLVVKRHLPFQVLTVDIREELVHAIDMMVEEAPHACVAVADSAEIKWVVGIAEREILVFPVEEPLLSRHLHHVLGIEHVRLVLHVETGDAALVGMCADAVVGHSDSHPHCPFASRALAHHLKHPCLVLVGDGEGLSLAVVAVFGHERCHDVDGIPGACGTFERDIDKRAIVHNSLRVHHLLPSSEGGLCDGHLILVDLSYHVVGSLRLTYLAVILVGVPVVDVAHLVFGMRASHMAEHISVHAVGVGVIGHHHTAVGRCVFAYDEVRAGSCFLTDCRKGNYTNC